MDFLLAIQQRYAEYMEQIADARKKAPPFAGLLGMGKDPRKHPCNEAFYRDVEGLADEFVRSRPDAQEALTLVRWMLAAPVGHEKEDAYWYLYAAQGHCRAMIPLLPPADCEELLAWYDQRFPRRKRLPVQEEIYTLLAKQAAK